jgi:hypothetical protein
VEAKGFQPMLTEWHPYLNSEDPDKMSAVDRLFWWKCKAAGHTTQQSVDHRQKSKGCVECTPSARQLARPSS